MRLLFVEDDPTFRKLVSESLEREFGKESSISVCSHLEEVVTSIQEETPQLALLDIMFPRNEADLRRGKVDPEAGIRVIEALEASRSSVRVVVLSSQDREFAVRLLVDHRIHDYLFKDTPWKEIRARLRGHVDDIRRSEENRQLRLEVGSARVSGVDMLGEAPSFLEAVGRALRVAPANTAVAIHGESGTGKELMAHLIHQRSLRNQAPFVVVNCAALSEHLLESELFGHRKGAFTGAMEDRVGRFELADGGTLFLDEIGELPLALQPKLLRVVQQQTFERLGESRSRTVDVRIVSATNRDLSREVAACQFREDLFYRLNVFELELPPLRKRREDIPLLARHFLRTLGRKVGRRIEDLDPRTVEILKCNSWPGNIRQLQNTIEAAMILENGNTLGPGSLPRLSVPASREQEPTEASYHDVMLRSESRFLEYWLKEKRGNTTQVAETIGLPTRTLRDRLQRCGLDPQKYRS